MLELAYYYTHDTEQTIESGQDYKWNCTKTHEQVPSTKQGRTDEICQNVILFLERELGLYHSPSQTWWCPNLFLSVAILVPMGHIMFHNYCKSLNLFALCFHPWNNTTRPLPDNSSSDKLFICVWVLEWCLFSPKECIPKSLLNFK